MVVCTKIISKFMKWVRRMQNILDEVFWLCYDFDVCIDTEEKILVRNKS